MFTCKLGTIKEAIKMRTHCDMLLLLLNEFYRKAWNNFLTFLQNYLAGDPSEAKITSGTDFMTFYVKALFSCNIRSIFFSVFYQILSTCQTSDQLNYPNRNYRVGGALAIPVCLQKAQPVWGKIFFIMSLF